MRKRVVQPFDSGHGRARGALLAVALVLLAGTVCGAAEPSHNIVLISVDGLRADHVGFYGYHRNTMPNLAKRAHQAVLFERAVTQASWTLPSFASLFASRYVQDHGVYHINQRLSSEEVLLAEVLQKAGYRWHKARRVLTSPDPEYREKVERLLRTLWGLAPDEMLFFIDEMGPLRVKRYGGRTYMTRHGEQSFPQIQADKGSICLSGALSATTNQVSWTYGDSKNTAAMIDLIEILFNQYYESRTIYLTWDTASWHGSNELVAWLDDLNEYTRMLGKGPSVVLIPLPKTPRWFVGLMTL